MNMQIEGLHQETLTVVRIEGALKLKWKRESLPALFLAHIPLVAFGITKKTATKVPILVFGCKEDGFPYTETLYADYRGGESGGPVLITKKGMQDSGLLSADYFREGDRVHIIGTPQDLCAETIRTLEA